MLLHVIPWHRCHREISYVSFDVTHADCEEAVLSYSVLLMHETEIYKTWPVKGKRVDGTHQFPGTVSHHRTVWNERVAFIAYIELYQYPSVNVH